MAAITTTVVAVTGNRTIGRAGETAESRAQGGAGCPPVTVDSGKPAAMFLSESDTPRGPAHPVTREDADSF